MISKTYDSQLGLRYEVTLFLRPGEFLYKFMAITDTKIYCFCDNNARKNRKTLDGEEYCLLNIE
jgi:hypothetical protein